ncbi:hypothetical protein D3C76_519740 [compost metagenome]
MITDTQQLVDLLQRVEDGSAGLHPDDAAVDRFAEALKAKLARSRAKGRGGWDNAEVCSAEDLARMLIEHLDKGNAGTFEDVATFAMMLHQRGAEPAALAEAIQARDAAARKEGWTGMKRIAGREIERLRQFERIFEGLPQEAIDGVWTAQGIRAHAKQQEDLLATAQAWVTELERALAPFAEVAEAYNPAEDDAFQPWKDAAGVDSLRLPLGQHRAARAVLRGVAPVAQAGQVPVIQMCQLGIYGKAYDGPETKRAYTYADQPNNQGAWRLGEATRAAMQTTAGDPIDRGLVLLRELQAKGFGVFELAATPAQGGE